MTDTFIDAETMPEQPEHAARAAIAENIQAPASMSKPETIEAWHRGADKYAGAKDALIDEQYRKTALDGTKGEIMSLSWAFDDDDEPLCVIRSGVEIEGAAVAGVGPDSEKALLEYAFERIRERIGQTIPYFIGHNIGGFDLKFIYQRAVINRVKPPFPLNQHGRHQQHYFDTMQEWAGFRGYISQDALCDAMGIGVDSPAGMDGSQVWDAYLDGRIDEIVTYNKADVSKAREIWRRQTFR